MPTALGYKIVAIGVAVMGAAGTEILARTQTMPAYGVPAVKIEADAAAREAGRAFVNADLNNDNALDEEEYAVLAVVTAELAALNGFVLIDSDGAKTAALRGVSDRMPGDAEKARVKDRAAREFSVFAGDDQRLSADEFVGAELERFLATDADRNGVLSGSELDAFARARSRLAVFTS